MILLKQLDVRMWGNMISDAKLGVLELVESEAEIPPTAGGWRVPFWLNS